MWMDGRGDLPGQLVVVSGPSGSGKSTLVRRALEHPAMKRLVLSVSATTRPAPARRAGRRRLLLREPGRVSKRASDGEVPRMMPSSTATATGHPASRSSRPWPQGKSVLLEIEVQGALQVREHRSIRVLRLHPTPRRFAILEQRLWAGGPKTRRRSSDGSARPARSSPRPTGTMFRLINDDLDRAVEDFVTALRSNGCGG